jgi:hypothetical protein
MAVVAILSDHVRTAYRLISLKRNLSQPDYPVIRVSEIDILPKK